MKRTVSLLTSWRAGRQGFILPVGDAEPWAIRLWEVDGANSDAEARAAVVAALAGVSLPERYRVVEVVR